MEKFKFEDGVDRSHLDVDHSAKDYRDQLAAYLRDFRKFIEVARVKSAGDIDKMKSAVKEKGHPDGPKFDYLLDSIDIDKSGFDRKRSFDEITRSLKDLILNKNNSRRTYSTEYNVAKKIKSFNNPANPIYERKYNEINEMPSLYRGDYEGNGWQELTGELRKEADSFEDISEAISRLKILLEISREAVKENGETLTYEIDFRSSNRILLQVQNILESIKWSIVRSLTAGNIGDSERIHYTYEGIGVSVEAIDKDQIENSTPEDLQNIIDMFISGRKLSSKMFNFEYDSWNKDSKEPRCFSATIGPRECLTVGTAVYANGGDQELDCSGRVLATVTMLTQEAYIRLLEKFQQLETRFPKYDD